MVNETQVLYSLRNTDDVV